MGQPNYRNGFEVTCQEHVLETLDMEEAADDLREFHIDWVIVGGESGPGARPMKEDWATDIRQQCEKAEIPFFFKQWGGVNKKKTGRELEGKTYDTMPLASA